jgi:hypothetical protein
VVRASLTVGHEDDTDSEEKDTHEETTESERPLAAEAVNTEENEDASGNNLEDTVKTGSKERCGSTTDTDGLENCGVLAEHMRFTVNVLVGA